MTAHYSKDLGINSFYNEKSQPPGKACQVTRAQTVIHTEVRLNPGPAASWPSYSAVTTFVSRCVSVRKVETRKPSSPGCHGRWIR